MKAFAVYRLQRLSDNLRPCEKTMRCLEAIFPLWPWDHKSAHRLTADFSSSRSFPVSLDRSIVLAQTAASWDNWALCYQGRKQLVWPLQFRCCFQKYECVTAALARACVRAVCDGCASCPRELTWIAPRRRARIDCEASGKRSTLGAERCSWSAGLHSESFSQRFFRAIFEGWGSRSKTEERRGRTLLREEEEEEESWRTEAHERR